MKTEARKVYSRVFWIFLPNIIKIDSYNFEVSPFKVCAFFSETQCSMVPVFADIYRAVTKTAPTSPWGLTSLVTMVDPVPHDGSQ